jgi:hypothetical protein
MKLNLSFLCIIVFLLSSQCTIQKRVYRSGWHVEFNRKYKSKEITTETIHKDSPLFNSKSIELEIEDKIIEKKEIDSISPDFMIEKEKNQQFSTALKSLEETAAKKIN